MVNKIIIKTGFRKRVKSESESVASDSLQAYAR